MSDYYSNWTTYTYLVLFGPHDSSVLMVPTEDGWSLPCVVGEEFYWWRSASRVDGIVERSLGHPLLSLRCLSNIDDPSVRVARRAYVFEDTDASYQPEGGEYVDLETLSDLPMAIPEHRPLVRAVLDDSRLAHREPPWSRPGWFESTRRWLESWAEASGYVLTDRVERYYNWPLAAVLRVETSSGLLYLKATATLPLLSNEPELTAQLASLFPDRVPMPLTVDTERGWMVLPDLGYPNREVPYHVQMDELRAYARLQSDSVAHVPQLLQAGCPDRRLQALEASISLLVRLTPQHSGLVASELQALRDAAPRLRKACQALGAYGVPDTLVHGDLFGGNIAGPEGQFVFFDWGQGCVSHPFFDAIHFLDEEEILTPTARDAYLSCWTQHEPMGRLQEAWVLALPLALLLNGLLRYHISSERGAQPEENVGAVAYNFRNCLRWLNQTSRC
jgi:hypothetical protein